MIFAACGYLQKLQEDPNAIIGLGDAAYNRSIVRRAIGLGTTENLLKSGRQLEVFFSFSFFLWTC